MKKIITLISLSFLFPACDNLDDMPPQANEKEAIQNPIVKHVLGENDYINYDSYVNIVSNVTLTPYEPYINDGSLHFEGWFPAKEKVGGVLINNRILLNRNNDYYKTYSYEQTDEMVSDKNELFGKTINIKTVDTSESSVYYNLNLNSTVLTRINKLEVFGLKDINKLYSNTDLLIKWDVTTETDENILLYLYDTKEVGAGNQPKQLVKKIKYKEGEIKISSSELNNLFLEDSDLVFTMVKAKQVSNFVSPSNKIFAVQSLEFLNYAGIKFKK